MEAPCWRSDGGAPTVELCEVCDDGKTKAYLPSCGGAAGLRAPPVSIPTEGESCLWPGEERATEEEGDCPLFSNCVFMSPLTVSVPRRFTMEAIVCSGEKSVGILFQSFLEVLCLTRWGLSTSCGCRQACSLCPFLCLSWHVSSLPSVSSF